MSNDIDVILPFHRIDKLLFAAIDSIAASSNIEVKLVCIDTSCETLEKRTKLRTYLESKNIEYEIFESKGNQDYADAINLGFQHVKAEYFALANSDDLMSKTRLSKQVNRLIQDGSEICICGYRKFVGRKMTIPSLTGSVGSDYFPELLLLGSYGADATLVGRTKWLENATPFVNIGNKSDWYFALRNYFGTQISFVPTQEYFYRIHRIQTTKKKQEINPILVNELYSKWEQILESKIDRDVLLTLALPGNFKVPCEKAELYLQICKKLASHFEDPRKKVVLYRLIQRRKSILALQRPCLALHKEFYSFAQILDVLKLLIELPKVLMFGRRF